VWRKSIVLKVSSTRRRRFCVLLWLSAEKALGAEHPDVAASLNNLGVFYYGRHQYAMAETTLPKSLGHLGKRPSELSTTTWFEAFVIWLRSIAPRIVTGTP
jgi:hypothetical protein